MQTVAIMTILRTMIYMPRTFHISNMNLQLSGIKILDGFNLDLQQGTFNTVLGLSGAGKTQLLRTLSNLNSSLVNNPLTSESVSFVFQKSLLFPWLNVFENLKITTRKSNHEIDIWLKKFNLFEHKFSFPDELSVGTQQKVNLSRAFITASSLVFMDEPFTALDHATKSQLHENLLQLWRETKCTLLFVTHDIDEALILSQNLFLLSKKEKRITKKITNLHAYPRQIFDPLFKDFYVDRYEEIAQFLADDYA